MKQIAIWTGDNFIEIIREMVELDEDLLVKIQNGRLVIRDGFTGYYQSAMIGDMVEIPDYS